MSYTPAIGGIGTGHLVREIDALGEVIAQPKQLAKQKKQAQSESEPKAATTRTTEIYV